MSLSEVIRRAREAAGLSQRDLARKLRITPGAVGQWETGQTSPTILARIELAELLDMRFTDLLPEAKGRARIVSDPELVSIVDMLERSAPEARKVFLAFLEGAHKGIARESPSAAPAPERRARIRN